MKNATILPSIIGFLIALLGLIALLEWRLHADPTSILLINFVIALFVGMLTGLFFSVKKLQRQAKNAQERLKGIIESSPDYIAAIDLDYKFITFNKMYQNEVYRLFRIDLKPGMNLDVLYEHAAPGTVSRSRKLWKEAMRGKPINVIETFPDSHYPNLHFEVRFNPIFDSNSKLIGVSHTATNITERVKNERKMAAYRRKLETLVSHLKEKNNALQLLKEFLNMLGVNDNLEETKEVIANYSKRLFPGTTGVFYFYSENKGVFERATHWGEPIVETEVIETTDCFSLLQNTSYYVKNMEDKPLCKHVSRSLKKPSKYMCIPLLAVNERVGLVYVEIFESAQAYPIDFIHIVCEQVARVLYNIQLKASLKVQSIQDPLTGLYNRRYFEQYLEHEIRIAKREEKTFSVLLLDIDHFKGINDTYGHPMGDEVLVHLANLLCNLFRESDLIARWGGEEFLILLRNADLHDAHMKAEKLRKQVEKSNLRVENHLMSFTVSIGISHFYFNETRDQLIKKADEALYQAKVLGRNRVAGAGNELLKSSNQVIHKDKTKAG